MCSFCSRVAAASSSASALVDFTPPFVQPHVCATYTLASYCLACSCLIYLYLGGGFPFSRQKASSFCLAVTYRICLGGRLADLASLLDEDLGGVVASDFGFLRTLSRSGLLEANELGEVCGSGLADVCMLSVTS